MAKKMVLLSISILAVSFFFILPQNHEWMKKRVFSYWNDFQRQKGNLDPEARKVKRYGNDYIYSKQIANSISRRTGLGNAVALLPPTAYFKSQGMEYHVPEPAVFYYYTGLKTIWVDSKQANTANWFVHVVSGRLRVDSVMSYEVLADTIKAFKKFPVSL